MNFVRIASASNWISKARQLAIDNWPRTKIVATQCMNDEASLTPCCNKNGGASTSNTKKNHCHMKHIPTLRITNNQNMIVPSYQIVNYETIVVLVHEILKILLDGRI
jgi:hypothetical protein